MRILPDRLPATGLLLLLAAAIVVALAVACSSDEASTHGTPAARPSTETIPTAGPAGSVAPEDAAVIVYRTPTCGCCAEYEGYLEDEGFPVDDVTVDDLSSIKDDLGIPEDMWSCHTSFVGDYFVEGHVPVEAILALLSERPAIDGIALPGMPAGSPGMGGDKEGPFVVYAITDGQTEEFMTI